MKTRFTNFIFIQKSNRINAHHLQRHISSKNRTQSIKMPVATHPSTLETPEFRLLNSYGSIDNISLASRLCSAVTNAAETNQSEDDIEQLLWRLWNAVLAVASKTAPAEQGKLAQLLQQMAKQGTLKNGDGKEVSVWDKKVWDDLPVFGAAAREVFNNGQSTIRRINDC
jgi:hypothetical protein